MRTLFLLLCAFAFVGCGTAVSQHSQISDLGVSAPIDIGPNGSPCARPDSQASNSLKTDLSVFEVCQGVNNGEVQVKLSAYPQLFGDYCIFPVSSFQTYHESCLTINGDPMITLSTDQYSGVVIVHKADEAAFNAYLANSNLSAPAYEFILLR